MKTVGWLTGAMLITADPALGGSWVVIGDSLSAEYASVLDGFPIPGVDDPTAYAAVTVEGWESMSWVEILGRLRPGLVHLGDYRSSLVGWGDLRFGGYEYNFAIPGFTASQWADIVTSSLFSNLQFLPYRRTLERVLREHADRVVIWLGGNEFRGRYHPNTSLQLMIARIMLDAFRQAYGSAAPGITDGEALALLGLDPDLPYWEWIAGADGVDADSDGDGHRNLVEYALGMDPTRADDPPVSWQAAAGALELHWAVDLARSRHVQVTPESSGDLRHWAPLPEGNITEGPDGRRIARLPLESGHRFLRLSVALVPVE